MVQSSRKQVGGSLRHRPRRAFRFRVVQNAAGAHPGADQQEQPGSGASVDIRLRTQAKHGQEYCTMLETRIVVRKVPADEETWPCRKERPGIFALTGGTGHLCGTLTGAQGECTEAQSQQNAGGDERGGFRDGGGCKPDCERA